jgi:hypothetical protein
VSEKPKRRWYQFSLRALLVVMTLAGSIFARVAYLRERFLFHRTEYELNHAAIQKDFPQLVKLVNQANENANFQIIGKPPSQEEVDSFRAKVDGEEQLLRFHLALAGRYRTAMFRPWMLVDTSPPLEGALP